MSASEETLRLLRSIDDSLRRLVDLSERRSSGRPAAAPEHEVASDADLLGKYGDPVIKARDPRDWAGPSMKGRRLSECSAEYLDLLAKRYDFFAQKANDENDQKKLKYARLDARRARGWAARIRAGKHTPAPALQDPTPDLDLPGDLPDGDYVDDGNGGGW